MLVLKKEITMIKKSVIDFITNISIVVRRSNNY